MQQPENTKTAKKERSRFQPLSLYFRRQKRNHYTTDMGKSCRNVYIPEQCEDVHTCFLVNTSLFRTI